MPAALKGRNHSYFAYLLIVCLAVAFFSPFFFQGQVFLAADTLYQYYPWKAYVAPGFMPHNPLITDPVNLFYAFNYGRFLEKGAFSKWNPFILTGVPAAVSLGAPGPYYPPKILLNLLFSPAVALTLLLFLHVTMMGCFMYLYLTQIGAGKRGALFGAVAYMFNGCAMVWLEFEMWVTPGAYFPLLLFCIERFANPRRYTFAFLGGLAYGLMLLSGSPQLNYYISLFLFIYALFMLFRHRRSALSILFCSAVMVGVGLLIGAAEVLPAYELISASSRAQRTFGFRQYFDTFAWVPLRYYVTLLFPDFFGSPILYLNMPPALPSQQYMNYNELTLYMGIPTVFAFAAGALRLRDSFARFYLIMMALLVAMLAGTIVYYPFFKFVPGMDQMNSSRIIFLFVFVFCVVAGLGVGGVDTLSSLQKRGFVFVAGALSLFVVLIAIFGSKPDLITFFNREQFITQGPGTSKLVESLRALRALSSAVIFRPLALVLIVAPLFVSFIFFSRRNVAGTLAFAGLIALLSFDLISFGRAYNTTSKPDLVYPVTPGIEFLRKQPGPFRVLQDTGSGLYVNTLAPFGIEELGGYISVYPERTNKIMSYMKTGPLAFSGATFDRWVMFDNAHGEFSSKFLDLMNVRYLLTSPYKLIQDQRYNLVFRNDLSIYENTRAMPRAYVVHNCKVERDPAATLAYMLSPDFDMRREVVLEQAPPAGFITPEKIPSSGFSAATIDRYSPNSIRLLADMPANGWLVLSDAFFPGWKATVDGAKAEILRANYNFRAVPLTAGKHTVVFTYDPLVLKVGTALTIMGAAIVFLGLSFVIVRGNRSKMPDDKLNS